MKLLFIANARIPSERAMATAIMKQCEAFANAGVEVELIVPTRHNTRTEDPFEYHDTAKHFSIRYLFSLDVPLLEKVRLRFFLQKLSFFVALNLYIWKTSTDILYSREPELIGPLVTKKKKFVELHHLYGLGYFGSLFLKRCRGVIAITNALRDDVCNKFSLPVSSTMVAPSGVDLSAFYHLNSKEVARARLSISTHKPVALYIGGFETWKGYKTFLDASGYLKDVIHFVIAGGGEEQVQKLRVEYPHVQFLGFLPQNELPQNQQIADVLVIPNSRKVAISARHTSPLKVFAHMASGIPIVASAVPSISEVLSSRNAILVTPDDPKALAEGIQRVIEEKEDSATMAERALEDVAKYDWSLRTASIISFINELPSEINR